jgi:hypothetical protein
MGDQRRQGVRPTGGLVRRLKAELVKAHLTLNGIATPGWDVTPGWRGTVLYSKIVGAVFALIGVATTYLFILRPIEAAKRTGVLHQGLYGIVMPFLLLYWGVAMIVTDLRNRETMLAGTDGRLRWTRMGRILQYGMCGTTALMLITWYLYVRSIGLKPFRHF